MKRSYAVLAVLILSFARPAAAQDRQVPLDEGGSVTVVDAALARAAGLWTERFPGFHEARMFGTPDGALILEITESVDGEFVRHRLPVSPEEAMSIRRAVSAARSGATPAGGVRDPAAWTQEGRNWLIGQTVIAGLAYYGWAVPLSLGVNDESTATGLYLLTSAASFFVPFALTSNSPVTYGMASLSRYGITRGALHGALLADIIVTEDVCLPEDPCGSFDKDERVRAGLGMLTSIGEGAAGYLWARNASMTDGDARTIGLGGDVGLATGFLGALLFDVENTETAAAAMLTGSALGLWGGVRVADDRQYTWGDTHLIYTGALTGAWALGAPTAVIEASEEATAGAALLGGWAGLYLIGQTVEGKRFTTGQAGLIGLSTLAGGLAGSGVGALMDNGDVAAIGSALGAIGGFAIGYSTFARDAPGSSVGDRFSIRLNPAALASVSDEADGPSVPFLSGTIRF